MRKIFYLTLLISIISCNSSETKEESNEIIYKGDLVDGKKHGLGMMTRGDKKAIGEFQDDHLNGIAEYTSTFGDYYLGEWINDQWDGIGTASWKEGEFAGDSCVCEYEESELNGFGHYFNNNGEIYIGFYENGKQNGFGTHQYNEGERKGDYYIGEIQNGLMHGKGFYFNAAENISAYLVYDNGEIVRQDSTLNRYVDSLEMQIEYLDEKLSIDFKEIEQKFEVIKKRIEIK